MPRDAVAITALASGTAAAQPAGTAINVTNGANVAAVGDTSRILVRVTNTHSSPHDVTFKAGATNPPAARGGLGDLVVTVANASEQIVVLESARFVKADGSIDVDFSAGFTGIVSAVRLPKGA